MNRPSNNHHGFTLTELMVAMAISLTILIMGAGVYLGSLGLYIGMQSRSSLSQDAILLVDYLRNELIVAGGGSVRAWMGIWVEDNCAARSVFPDCAGSDRLTLTTASNPLQECGITSMVSAGVLQVAFSSPGVCCLQPAAAGEISFLGQNTIVTLDGNFTNQYVTAVDLAACRITIQPGQAAGWDQSGGVVDWSGGTVTLVNVETLYLDPPTEVLMRFTDRNNDGVVDAGEAAIVAIGVLDFQVALGYDFNPADGKITTLAGGLNDEWLYNAVGETFGAGVFTGSFTKSSLLMVSPAVILGVTDGSANTNWSTKQVLNGPARGRAGMTIQPEITQLAPRNSYVFQ